MIGCRVALKCFVACLFLLESQQPTCPQLRQSRKCTHVSPVCKHSSQPCELGATSRIWPRCVQIEFIMFSHTERRRGGLRARRRPIIDDGKRFPRSRHTTGVPRRGAHTRDLPKITVWS